MAKVLKNVSKISGVYGQPGEEKVSDLLEQTLPDDYVILNSPRVSYHGATIDIDHVVVGPTGIFAIESKNMHGKIFGGLMGNWTQERKKTGKNRRVKIGNPANQVNHYAKIVKSFLTVRYLNEYGGNVNVKLYPVVVFVHEEADLSEMEYTRNGYIGRAKIMKIDELVNFILSREGVRYETQDVERFSEILVPSDQRDQTEYFAPGFLMEQKEQVVKRYEVYEEIGRGNFGSVYRGFDFKLDREVAIKKMHKRQKDPEALRRFFREAQINAKLSHENIVSVYDYYEEDGDYYLIMEFVDGPTLEDYIKERILEPKEIYNLINPVLDALEHAHENHVVHRDLKPANILLTSDDKVKVSDFGIARLTEDASMTQTSAAVGTPSVMSPEQITGQLVDERTDIFGIGILLFLMVTGSYPFAGDHIGEVVNKILYHEPVPLRQISQKVTPAVEKVVFKCLAKDPVERFSSIAELRDALKCAFLENRELCLNADTKIYASLANSRFGRFIPSPLKSFLRSDKKVLNAIIVISFIAIISLLGLQAYTDSRMAGADYPHTQQYGFTNENLKALYADPDKFKGVPINVVGKIGKIIQLTENSTIFTITVEGASPYKDLVVEYRQPHFMMQVSEFIRVAGSVQSTAKLKGETVGTPVMVADKIEPMPDPWSILAPPILAVHPNQTKNMNGEVVQLNKVEFAARETRLFVTVANYSDKKAYFVLSRPMGRQGNKMYKEVPNRYGVYSQATLELMPGEYINEVIFLEPMDPVENAAKFVFGSDLSIADNEKPYVFDVTW